MSDVAGRIKELRKLYVSEMDEVKATITVALCEAYKNVTGKKASDRLEEAIAEALSLEEL